MIVKCHAPVLDSAQWIRRKAISVNGLTELE